jgi:hypothetical protein
MMLPRRLLVLAGLAILGAAAFADDDKPDGKKPDEKKPSDAKPFDLDRFIKKYDKNKDGQLDRQECPEPLRQIFDKIDRNKDGKLDRGELERIADHLARLTGEGAGRPGGRPGEIITPAAPGERIKNRLKVGDLAPDFTLPAAEGKRSVQLSSFQGKRPVVLIFASYT